MIYPESIRKRLNGKTGHTNTLGMSGSSVTVFSDCVLKVQPLTPDTRQGIETMMWLSRRLPTPKVLCYEEMDGMAYLLMERMEGMEACEEACLERPRETVAALAQGMRLLWDTDPSGCPRHLNMDKLLALAEDQGPMDDFRQERLTWLRENRPESVPVLAHGDYCLPNVFLKDGSFRGFIDVGEMGLGEKWRDIALCWRSLRDNYNGTYGGRVYPDFDPDMLFECLGIEPDWEQIRWHLSLEELL